MMAVRDPKTWLHGIIQVMCLTVLYGFSVFLPIILRFGFNYSVRQSQYLSIPVFAWGSIVYGCAGYLSDRYSRRFLACVLCAPVGMVGYAILLGGQDLAVGVKYFACFLIASCAWMLGGGNLAWFSTVSASPVRLGDVVGGGAEWAVCLCGGKGWKREERRMQWMLTIADRTRLPTESAQPASALASR
jgi:nitrate/nitrite transporter NarK